MQWTSPLSASLSDPVQTLTRWDVKRVGHDLQDLHLHLQKLLRAILTEGSSDQLHQHTRTRTIQSLTSGGRHLPLCAHRFHRTDRAAHRCQDSEFPLAFYNWMFPAVEGVMRGQLYHDRHIKQAHTYEARRRHATPTSCNSPRRISRPRARKESIYRGADTNNQHLVDI